MNLRVLFVFYILAKFTRSLVEVNNYDDKRLCRYV